MGAPDIYMHRTAADRTIGPLSHRLAPGIQNELPPAYQANEPLLAVKRLAVTIDRLRTATGAYDPLRQRCAAAIFVAWVRLHI